MWTLLTTDTGSPEALATPLTLSVETESKTENSWKAACGIDEGAGTSVATMKGSGQKSVSIKQQSTEMRAQAMFKLSGDLKTYDLLAGVSGVKGKEVTQTRTDTKGCRDGVMHTDPSGRYR